MTLSKFWWSDSRDGRGLHWTRWEDLCVSKMDGGLGFRDFEAFNLVFLAKQGWRLIHSTSTLCYKVFKARYFPTTSFLKAPLGSNPSYVWRSILEGRSVVTLGSKWRIGDGVSVRIMEDTWLPSLPLGRPSSMEPDILDHGVVAELIDSENRCWKEDLLHSLFSPNEAEAILDINLSLQRSEDKLIWLMSKMGTFTVRSAYHIARISLDREVPDPDLRNPKWRLLWTAKVIPKVKVFIWRWCNGFLPSRSILRSRHLEVCGEPSESLAHLFFDCHIAQLVWSDVAGWMEDFVENNEDAIDFCLNLLVAAKQKGNLEKVLVTLWMLWYNRNLCLHEGHCSTSYTLARKIDAMVKEYEEGMVSINGERMVKRGNHVKQWSPPPPGSLKLNYDAAFNNQTEMANLGMVIRNAIGDVILGRVSNVENVPSVMHPECLAIIFGLESAWEHDYSSLVVESDCKQAVDEIAKGHESFWSSAF